MVEQTYPEPDSKVLEDRLEKAGDRVRLRGLLPWVLGGRSSVFLCERKFDVVEMSMNVEISVRLRHCPVKRASMDMVDMSRHQVICVSVKPRSAKYCASFQRIDQRTKAKNLALVHRQNSFADPIESATKHRTVDLPSCLTGLITLSVDFVNPVDDFSACCISLRGDLSLRPIARLTHRRGPWGARVQSIAADRTEVLEKRDRQGFRRDRRARRIFSEQVSFDRLCTDSKDRFRTLKLHGIELLRMTIFISAGEPSGDLHAANLIRSLRKSFPDARFDGFGGARMVDAGATLHYPLVDLALMWFLNVLLNLFTFIRLIFVADRYFREEHPAAVVLVDYPGLNWWIARRAKARGIPVFYFVPPQIWAWGGWRVGKVRKYIDLVLCSLPFEPAWYHARGVAGAVYIGHPYFDELADRPLDEHFLAEQNTRPGSVVAILPGSRVQEITRNLPDFVRAATKLAEKRAGVRFAVACLHDRHKVLAEGIVARTIAQAGAPPGLAIEVHAGKTPELIRLARVAWAVSGSVGLELMVEALPSVVLYKVNRFDLWVARPFIRARYISLVNLLAEKEVFPEYLTWRDMSDELVRWALDWLDGGPARTYATESLTTLRHVVAQPGASDRAAQRIALWINHHEDPVGRRNDPMAA
jgi:lipid-A-disaccharide synthase